jgi:hypothetical protein
MYEPKTQKKSDHKISGDFFGVPSVGSNAIPVAKAIKMNDASQINNVRGMRRADLAFGVSFIISFCRSRGHETLI